MADNNPFRLPLFNPPDNYANQRTATVGSPALDNPEFKVADNRNFLARMSQPASVDPLAGGFDPLGAYMGGAQAPAPDKTQGINLPLPSALRAAMGQPVFSDAAPAPAPQPTPTERGSEYYLGQAERDKADRANGGIAGAANANSLIPSEDKMGWVKEAHGWRRATAADYLPVMMQQAALNKTVAETAKLGSEATKNLRQPYGERAGTGYLDMVMAQYQKNLEAAQGKPDVLKALNDNLLKQYIAAMQKAQPLQGVFAVDQATN